MHTGPLWVSAFCMYSYVCIAFVITEVISNPSNLQKEFLLWYHLFMWINWITSQRNEQTHNERTSLVLRQNVVIYVMNYDLLFWFIPFMFLFQLFRQMSLKNFNKEFLWEKKCSFFIVHKMLMILLNKIYANEIISIHTLIINICACFLDYTVFCVHDNIWLIHREWSCIIKNYTSF